MPAMEQRQRRRTRSSWVALQALNFLVLLAFVSSIVAAAMHYNASMINNSVEQLVQPLFPLFLLWIGCLTYFFSLFSFEGRDGSPTRINLATSPNEARKFEQSVLNYNQKVAAFHENHPKMSVSSVSSAAPAPAPAPAPAARHEPVICSDLPAGCKSNLSALNPPSDLDSAEFMTNEELLQCLLSGSIKDYQLEKKLGDYERAVAVRRSLYEVLLQKNLDLVPYQHYDYNKVFGANCEIVLGYVPIPLGLVGPLVINGEPIYVPMATTEGCLVASTNRGCKALTVSGGCSAVVLKDAITRAPCVRMPSAVRAAALKKWISLPQNYSVIEKAFNSTTSFGRLESVDATVAGRNVYLRFACMSGDAMGMNMVSKGCLKAIDELKAVFPDMELIAISGNMCTDKKPAAINWILGRGKSIVVEAVVSETVVQSVLKSSVKEMIDTNRQKNLIGSAMAGSVGGFNAHAANILTAIYLATGQDPAQNVESSNCLTIMELAEDGKSLYVSVTMPSIEVGTVGGGTHLPAQAGCLDICGVRGASRSSPGDNSRKLATIVGSAVLAGELSLIAALAANHLVNSHMQHNRKPQAQTDNMSSSSKPKIRKNASMPELHAN